LARSIRVIRIDNQQNGGVVAARVQSSVQSLHHQRRDLHQLTYLYLSEDQDPTSHQELSDFRLLVRYFYVPLVKFTVIHTEIYRKAPKFTLSVVL
jgi:hypothetical protein